MKTKTTDNRSALLKELDSINTQIKRNEKRNDKAQTVLDREAERLNALAVQIANARNAAIGAREKANRPLQRRARFIREEIGREIGAIRTRIGPCGPILGADIERD